jgi:hypothetical protein
MLLFVDESGHNRREMPYEVLAGIAVAEDNLWNLVQAIRSAEKDNFGDYLRDVLAGEIKAKTLLKRKRFKEAERNVELSPDECLALTKSLLAKGKQSRGRPVSNPTFKEIVAYSRKALDFVHAVIDLAARYSVQVFASVVPISTARPNRDLLRKDYVYLFERYFYFLETLPPRERGLIVFDEIDKAKSHILLHQMSKYFLGTGLGKYRSSRIVPEPFFVHSDLTTGVFLADLAAYIIGSGWRLRSMTGPVRDELIPFADKLREMQFRGEKPRDYEDGVWNLHGIAYIDNLVGQFDRE